MAADPALVLPSSPLLLRDDRFSLTNSSEDLVPFFVILKAILTQLPTNADNFVEQLDTISATLSNDAPASDYDGLRSFIQLQGVDFFSSTWPKLVELALDMPSLFPSNDLPFLTPEHPRNVFSRRQIACLVVHQFIGTLPPPYWMKDSGGGSQDFRIWYSEYQPHPKAVHAYLSALFVYFDKIANQEGFLDEPVDSWPISMALYCSPPVESQASPLAAFNFEIIDEPTTSVHLLGLPNGASVISCNKFVGFGRTGTQEEVQVGSSPEAAPIVLMTPPLRDNEVLVVSGAEMMVTIDGYAREARLGGPIPQQERWKDRTMLFMDALEFDAFDRDNGLPDLLIGNVDREFRKAYTAFTSKSFDRIFTGGWGCGSFGGNLDVKTTIQWCAASHAGVPLSFVCLHEAKDFVEQFTKFQETVRQGDYFAVDVMRALKTIPLDLAPDAVLTQVLEALRGDLNRNYGAVSDKTM